MQKDKKKNAVTSKVSDERITIDLKDFFEYVQQRENEEQSAIPQNKN